MTKYIFSGSVTQNFNMDLRVKFQKEIEEIENRTTKVLKKRKSLGAQIEKVAGLREKLIDEIIIEIRASLDFDDDEVRFIELSVGKESLLKDLIMRSDYIPITAGKIKSKDSHVSVSKSRIRTTCRVEDIRSFIKEINLKLAYFDIKIQIVGETSQRVFFQMSKIYF